jgi:hypothetical protein
MARAVQTAIDSLNFFVESRNAGNIIVGQSTAGALSPTSLDQVNTDQHGAMFFITVSSISVNTATLALNINAKDVQSGTYFPYVRVSVDSVTNTGPSQELVLMYVGAVVQAGIVNSNVQAIGMPVPGTFQVVASLTITTTASQTGSLTYSVDYGKVM